jgi:hypothetical protein
MTILFALACLIFVVTLTLLVIIGRVKPQHSNKIEFDPEVERLLELDEHEQSISN